MSSLFFEGDLSSGINIAVRDSKSVACFIGDDGDESSKWELDYLGDPQVQSALIDRAITFRIKAGSEEAANLAAYYPVSVFPALILIHNGALALQLKAGQDKSVFKSELLTTLVAVSMNANTSLPRTEAVTSSPLTEDMPPSSQTHGTPSPRDPHTLQDSPSTAPFTQENRVGSSQRNIPTDTQASVANEEIDTGLESSNANQQSAVQRLLQDRRRKLETEKVKKDLEDHAERKAKADARKKAIHAAPDSAKAKQATYAQEQRKRNIEAKAERERVLRQIEQDKLERKEREERRKALMKAEAREGVDEDSKPSGTNPRIESMAEPKFGAEDKAQRSRTCAVQVRLFDGSTIRNKFVIDQTLTDVRDWVDKERSDDTPFTFKQILTPLPNRSLLISEEKERLIELGFIPTATLVTVPIQGYTAAYTDPSPSIISRIPAFSLNTVTTGVGLVSGALGTFLGLGQAVPSQEDSSAQVPPTSQSHQHPSSPDSSSHIRTFRGQRGGRDEDELYNGNQINVHPRNDDDDKDK